MMDLWQKPLKKKEFKRAGHFIRYIPRGADGIDNHYNYEATQEDQLFVAGLKGSPFTMAEFDKLMNVFENENAEEEGAKSFQSFGPAVEALSLKKNPADVEKIYEVTL